MILDRFIEIANFIGIVAFSLSGFFKAQKYQLDLFGAVTLGVITSVGGGMTRDVLLNKRPDIFIHPNDMFVAIFVVIVFSFYFKARIFKTDVKKKKDKLIKFVKITDAIGLSIFIIIGSEIALKQNVNTLTVVLLATITSVFGGVIRDLLVCEIPFILKEDVYAILCIIGSLFYVKLIEFSVNKIVATLIVFSSVLLIRIIVIMYNLQLPRIGEEDESRN